MSQQFGYPQFDGQGIKKLTIAGDAENDMMMDIEIRRMEAGQKLSLFSDSEETAVLLITGQVVYRWEEKEQEGSRHDFINEGPYCLHVCRGRQIQVEACADSEILVQKTKNDNLFEPVFYTPETCRDEVFGEGVCGGKLVRTVRTIFDYQNAPYSNMVNGEVITHQGNWSSYTPHSHPQPEVYYYRFQRKEGFGACFIGGNAYKIADGSFAAITPGETHPQVTAPGYPMYYCWMIRHLPGNPWTTRDDDPRYIWIKQQ